MATQTLHFTVGEDAGVLLMNIAQEHLIYNNNPLQALKTLTDSLMGCPDELALKILIGEYVLPVDVESQQFICQPRNEVENPDMFPQINIKNFCVENAEEINNRGSNMLGILAQMEVTLRTKKVNFCFNYEEILKFVSGDQEDLINEIVERDEVSEFELCVNVVKAYMEKSVRVADTIDWMIKTFPYEVKGMLLVDYREKLLMVITDFKDLYHMNYIETKGKFEFVDSYIQASMEIDEIVKAGITPVDIMQNYSAGWLAPNGDFYGLNGQIANMLHIQIGDALLEAGIIPEDYRPAVNPDAWLEQQGWVKIHGANVQFAGCLNERIDLKNVNISNVQLKKIYEYIALCHEGRMKAGWRMEFVSATRFKDWYESDPDAVNQKYFAY